MTFCSKCGNQLSEDIKFCPSCGTRKILPSKEVASEDIKEDREEVQTAVEENNINKTPNPQSVKQSKQRKPIYIGIGCLAAAILVCGGIITSIRGGIDDSFSAISEEIRLESGLNEESDYSNENKVKDSSVVSYNEVEAETEEKAMFLAAKASGRVSELGNYVEEYPYGVFVVEAKSLALKSMNRQRSRAAFNAFKKVFGDPIFEEDYTGFGVRVSSIGNRYEGDFVDGKQTGKGTYFYVEGDRYEGDYIDGKRTGKGTYFYASGARYEGDYIGGKRTGKGTYFYASGARYEGDYIDGKQTGKGKYYVDGHLTYEGDYIDGVFHGKGKYYVDGHLAYEGEFTDDG